MYVWEVIFVWETDCLGISRGIRLNTNLHLITFQLRAYDPILGGWDIEMGGPQLADRLASSQSHLAPLVAHLSWCKLNRSFDGSSTHSATICYSLWNTCSWVVTPSLKIMLTGLKSTPNGTLAYMFNGSHFSNDSFQNCSNVIISSKLRLILDAFCKKKKKLEAINPYSKTSFFF